jgi:hypothetical protein
MDRNTLNLNWRRSIRRIAALLTLTLAASVSTAFAETLLMPKRDMLMGVSEVVWGITTLPNGAATTYQFDFDNDGVFDANGTVTDRSYIAVNRVFPLAGTFTVKLRVTNGATIEEATTEVNVYDASVLAPADLRNLNVNRAIQNGLRYLWFSQNNRTTFDTTNTATWNGFDFPVAFTSLVVTAFENHGYQLPNNNSAPTGLYQKYVVRRGLNAVLAALTATNLTVQTAGDPCAGGLGPAPCQGLELDESGGHSVYETGLAVLPLAASGALSRPADVGIAGLVNGQPYSAILQRLVNSIAWGQGDGAAGVASNARGAWHYDLNNQGQGDGSSEGWIMLALLDATAAGAQVPAFVKSQWADPLAGVARGLNNDGSFDYGHDGNRASNNAVNVAKTGVGLQGMFYAGRPGTDADVLNAQNYINARWHAPSGESFLCPNGTTNKGCGYGMFNVFKGLKLYGVTTLTNVNRPAGTVGDPDDWHADYTDWLVANQTAPTTPTGGHWGPLHFSSQRAQIEAPEAALALLILAPTALVLPDPTTFSSVGLQHGNPLTTNPVTNPVGTNHTVTAVATSSGGAPVATATVNFVVLSGPNAGKSGSAVTDNQGKATFTYLDTAGPGTDRIQASIGQLQSNVVDKIWQANVSRCDTEPDGDVDMADLTAIRSRNGQAASSPTDPYDGNGDGSINVADVRYCQLRMTPTAQ